MPASTTSKFASVNSCFPETASSSWFTGNFHACQPHSAISNSKKHLFCCVPFRPLHEKTCSSLPPAARRPAIVNPRPTPHPKPVTASRRCLWPIIRCSISPAYRRRRSSRSCFLAPGDEDPAFWQPDDAAIAFQNADVILMNGAGYSKWAEKVTLPQSKVVDTSAAFAKAQFHRDQSGHHTQPRSRRRAQSQRHRLHHMDRPHSRRPTSGSREDALAALVPDAERTSPKH
jgi:hypothetical protein